MEMYLSCCSCLITHFFHLPGAEMNRHHYSLYVHNCRLVFLLRRDFTQIDTFRPAEFHWKLDQVGELGKSVCVHACVRLVCAPSESEQRLRVIPCSRWRACVIFVVKGEAFHSNYNRCSITFLFSHQEIRKCTHIRTSPNSTPAANPPLSVMYLLSC